MNITARILQLINDKGVTQQELAEALGVSQAAVNEWMNGKIQTLRKSNAVKLCRFLGMDYDQEMKSQKRRLDATGFVNVAGNNSGLAIQAHNAGKDEGREGAFTALDIIRRVSACDATDEEKGLTLRILNKAGII